MDCPFCHIEIAPGTKRCPHCEQRIPVLRHDRQKRFYTTLLLCLFFGGFGAHRFYVGKTRTGLLMLLTLGGLGVWSLFDLITIIRGDFRDKDGYWIN